MGKSRKKHPIGGNCSANGQKLFRSMENRAKRHIVKTRLKVEQYDKMPHEKEYGNEWASPRDGVRYWSSRIYGFLDKWMRK